MSWLLVSAVMFPAIIAYGILYWQAVSVPYQDDYEAILGFAIDYAQLPTSTAKVVSIATKQHNEYKLGFEHSIVASELELTRHLNFSFLIALGDLFLLPTAYLLWRTHQQNEPDLNLRLFAFVPISLIFFSLSYWENLNWAMTGLQNTPVIFFGLLSLYLLAAATSSQPTLTPFFLACLSALLAACTSANAFLLGPVGLLILLPRHAYARSLMWCASFILPLGCYLYHYVPIVHPMYRAYYITRPLFFLAFFGCVIPSRWPAALLGAMILSIVLLAFVNRFYRTNPVLFYLAVWIVATGALVGWVRGAAAFATISRYSIYSVLMLIFCYSFLLKYLPDHWPGFDRRRFYLTSTALAAVMFLLVNTDAYRELGARRRMVLSGIEFYRVNPEANSPMVDPAVERLYPEEKSAERAILNKAIEEHIYTLPPRHDLRQR